MEAVKLSEFRDCGTTSQKYKNRLRSAFTGMLYPR